MVARFHPKTVFIAAVTMSVMGCSTRVEQSDAIGEGSRPKESQQAVADHPGLPFYSVDHYDESRDPAADLLATIHRATAERKRILIQVGGDWCGWCRLMSEFIESNQPVRALITDNFIIMKVTYTNDQPNEAFLSKYPNIPAYPHLFVLDSDGTILHSQETGGLEEGKGYHEERYCDFLAAWKPGGETK